MTIRGFIPGQPLALFGAGPDGALGRLWQPARHTGWSGWDEVGIQVRSAPSARQNLDGRVEVFATGPSGRLGHFWEVFPASGRWSSWEDLGTEVAGDPAAFQNVNGLLEVFGIGPDGCLGHTWQLGGTAGWSGWDSFGHPLHSAPTVFQNATGRLEVFAIGSDHCLGHVWQQRGPGGSTDWSDWGSFGHAIQSAPTVFQNAAGRLEVFAVGPDGCLGHVWQQLDENGVTYWSDWSSFGHPIRGPLDVFQNADGRLELFAAGPDGAVGHVWCLESDATSGWSDWQSLGVVIDGGPAVFQNADGCLEVFAAGPGGRLGHFWQLEPGGTSLGWSDWEELGPPIGEWRLAICQHHDLGHSESGTTHRRKSSVRASGLASKLTGDVCVIGAGPAGITIADSLLRAGAKVVLVESGGWHEEADAQDLNQGDADGPIIKAHLKYLRQSRRRMVQGSAAGWGNYGWCLPFRTIDFESRAWVAHSGWPLAVAEITPYERRAAATFSFDPFAAPRPDGPLVALSYHYPPNPLLFRARLVELLPNPALQLELGATAVELAVTGDRIASVRCARPSGDELRVKADTVVLAAGAIENARLLLIHEGALPTSATMTGRFFMEHPHVLAGTVMVPDPEPLRSFLVDYDRLDVFALADTVQQEERLLNASVQLRPTGRGRSLVEQTGEPLECRLYVRAEQSPNPESRVLLGERTDRFGCARPHLHWLLKNQDWESVVRTATLVASALEARLGMTATVCIQPENPWPWEPADPGDGGNATWGNHHMGTTRMSNDPAEGVVDRNCLVHGTTNLYIAGSSVFPTGGCANPTFEIVALAHRLAEHLSTQSGRPPETAANERIHV